MKVRALVTFSTIWGGVVCGDVADIDPEKASAWISSGLVERISPEVETATRSAPEQAVTRKGRR
jgi:hypothetical protein